MAAPLPALRRTLELMPSPVPDSPGLLVRDPFRYAEAVLILPPPLVPCLLLFDGRHDEGDLHDLLVRLAGEAGAGDLLTHLRDTLSRGGFLENEAFEDLREARHQGFAAQATRPALHAGSAYPRDPAELRALLERWLEEAPRAAALPGTLAAIAAPHVSPEGAWRSYGAAYAALAPDLGDRTFVVLGTSHYGAPERFGLTRKPFVTPLGETRVDLELAARIEAAAGPAACLEDYCHAVEHSIEFQVVFLQHLYGAGVRILPVLCGPFARATQGRGAPVDDDGIRRVVDALGEMASALGPRLAWVAGVDMAHVGRRYGDRAVAHTDEGFLVDVATLDRERCARLAAGDAAGFWSLVGGQGDPLRWCGASPLYTLVAALRPAHGAVLHYEQWNIDAESVVSCAALGWWA